MSLFAEYLNDNLLSINTTGRDDAFADKILRQAIENIVTSYYRNSRRIYLMFYYPSDEYISILMSVPVKEELDLKKAAKAVNEKSVSMIKQKELLPLTGYVHGGCSPIGMKKQFPTIINETAVSYDKIFVSAGKVGFQIDLYPENLIDMVRADIADIV